MATTTSAAVPIRGRGRPFKLTEDRIRRVVNAVQVGAYPRIAAEAGGLSKSTFYNYMNRGEELYALAIDQDLFDNEPEPQAGTEEHQIETAILRDAGWSERDILLVSFYRQVQLAEGQAEVRLIHTWYVTAIQNKDWRAIRDFAGRRWRTRWGPNSKGEPELDWFRHSEPVPGAATTDRLADYLTVDQARAAESSPILRDVLSELVAVKAQVAELRASAQTR